MWDIYVGFAMTSRSSTERLGDFSSESVESHLVSWVSSCVACLVFWLGVGFWLCCLGLVLGDTWLFALTYSPTCGNSQSKTIRFDDRLSLERARHELKKNHGKKCTTKHPHANNYFSQKLSIFPLQ